MIPSGRAWKQQQLSLATVRGELAALKAENQSLREENAKLFASIEQLSGTVALAVSIHQISRARLASQDARLAELHAAWPFVVPPIQPFDPGESTTLGTPVCDPTLGAGG